MFHIVLLQYCSVSYCRVVVLLSKYLNHREYYYYFVSLLFIYRSIFLFHYLNINLNFAIISYIYYISRILMLKSINILMSDSWYGNNSTTKSTAKSSPFSWRWELYRAKILCSVDLYQYSEQKD